MIRMLLVATAALSTFCGWWVTHQAAIPSPVEQPRHRWVRTAEGWEHPEWESPDQFQRGLHPLVAALAMALASALALLSLPTGSDGREQELAEAAIRSNRMPGALPAP